MAEIKKVATVKPAAAAEEKPAVTAVLEKKEVKPAVKEAAMEAPAKKAPAKKAEAKPAAKAKAPAKKEAAKKAPAKKTEAKPAAKAVTKKAAKQVINLQFSGKSYTMEDIVKIASDVWKFDLHKNDEEYKSLELYVKPEENVAYYVFNGDISGSFFI